MNKLVANTLGLTLAAVVAANAVGAQNAQSTKPTSITVAETSISKNSWTVAPINLETTQAQNETLDRLTKDLNRKISQSFDITLKQKLESLSEVD